MSFATGKRVSAESGVSANLRDRHFADQVLADVADLLMAGELSSLLAHNCAPFLQGATR